MHCRMKLSDEQRKNRAVANWLLVGVGMIVIQVLLGGVTRLTGSGLSITEWKPIMGAMPPTTEAAWEEAFAGYKQIAQYKYMNSHFELSDFKFIFFWEWFHRLWARMLGVVFGIGFIFFLIRGYFKKDMVVPLVMLFILGAAQGLVGWIMVASGLNDTNLYVDHIKLAMHFIAALILLCYTLWFALKLLIPDSKRVHNTPLRNFTLLTIALLTVQLIYGAFMAGLKAAMSAATWPDINGSFIPSTIWGQSFINHPINIHFIHRMVAYLLFALIMIWFSKATKLLKQEQNTLWGRVRWWPFVLVWLQVILGIVTVLAAPTMQFGKFGTFEVLAELHQLFAMFLLMSLVVSAYMLRAKKA